ncbi:MAG: substrate-binding domain-containing protein [Anaerolineae bacterium]|nr:substrate-binding domain-containing protein [Anaerolineae bacterium]
MPEQVKISMSQVKRANRQRPRPTIGLLTEIGGSSYHNALWAGFADAAPDLDVNLICYVGGTINASTYGFDAQRNILYHLVGAERVDGLIISGTIGNFITTEEFRSFINRYDPLPMVGITQTPGLPCVVVDNEKGMQDIITHFIEAHGYRRIAFVCGPENNEEAALRYRAYVAALAKHGLPLNPGLVAPGDFTYETGREAIRLLLDERKVEFDAIVAVNDWMAFGVLKALDDRGIRVPNDVALGGFDDTREAAASHPSLTTVRQPIHKLGRAGLEVLLKLLAGEQVPAQTALSTKLIARQSCGCSEPVVAHAAVGPLASKGGPLPEVIVARREEILSEMVREAGEAAPASPEWAGRLLDAFWEEITSGAAASEPGAGSTPPSPFLLALDDVLHQAVAVINHMDDWQEVLSVMRRHLLPYLTNVTTLSWVEDLFSQGRVMVGRIAQLNWARQEVRRIQRAAALSYFGGDLIAAVETEQIFDVIGHNLPQLDFLTFYLSFYEGQDRPARWSRLMLGYDRRKRVEVGAGGWRFPTRQLIPDELCPPERRYTWVVESLNFRENRFGCLILEAGSREGEIYGALARQISGALQDSLLLQKHRQAEEILTRQAQELVRSNAELEQFAYVASHDLQEPLRMVKSYLQLLERRYQGRLDQDADEFIAFAVDGAERMRILINDLLEYSRVTTHGKPFAPTACAAVLDQVLANLKIALEESGAVVTYDELPVVLADETQLIRLLQNLIGNAIKFRQAESRPEIHVRAEHSGGEWTFSVRDNGIGIAPEDFERIFMIFRRLHSREEYAGTGIGLAVCKKIVERHGGRIWVKSGAGQGSTFYFTILDKGSRAM